MQVLFEQSVPLSLALTLAPLVLLDQSPELAQLLALRLEDVGEVVGVLATVAWHRLHSSLDALSQLLQLGLLALTLSTHLVQLRLQQQRLLGQISLADFSQGELRLGDFGLQLLVCLFLASHVLVLDFDKRAHPGHFSLLSVDFFFFLLDCSSQLLHLLVNLARLPALLLDFDLQLADERCEFLDLTVFVLHLPLHRPLIFRLLLLRVLLETRLQLINLIKGVPDFDLVFGVHDFPQAFHLLSEILSRSLRDDWLLFGRLSLLLVFEWLSLRGPLLVDSLLGMTLVIILPSAMPIMSTTPALIRARF